MSKVQIYVPAAFRLNRRGEEPIEFSQGVHRVDREVAEHWFVKANTGEPPAADEDNDLRTENAELRAENARLVSENDDLRRRFQDDKDNAQDGAQSDSKAEPEIEDEDTVASWNADDVIAYVADHPHDATRVVEIEKKRSNPRSSVLKAVEKVAG